MPERPTLTSCPPPGRGDAVPRGDTEAVAVRRPGAQGLAPDTTRAPRHATPDDWRIGLAAGRSDSRPVGPTRGRSVRARPVGPSPRPVRPTHRSVPPTPVGRRRIRELAPQQADFLLDGVDAPAPPLPHAPVPSAARRRTAVPPAVVHPLHTRTLTPPPRPLTPRPHRGPAEGTPRALREAAPVRRMNRSAWLPPNVVTVRSGRVPETMPRAVNDVTAWLAISRYPRKRELSLPNTLDSYA